jgi:hypothetical protein
VELGVGHAVAGRRAELASRRGEAEVGRGRRCEGCVEGVHHGTGDDRKEDDLAKGDGLEVVESSELVAERLGASVKGAGLQSGVSDQGSVRIGEDVVVRECEDLGAVGHPRGDGARGDGRMPDRDADGDGAWPALGGVAHAVAVCLAGGTEPGVEATRHASANAHPLELGGKAADPRLRREHPDLGLAVGAQGRPAGDDAARGHQDRCMAPLHLGGRAEAREPLGAISGSARCGGGQEGGRKPTRDHNRKPGAHHHHSTEPRTGWPICP